MEQLYTQVLAYIFSFIVATENVSSSVHITVDSPAKIQRQGSLVPATAHSQEHGRNVTTASVADLVISVPFPAVSPVLVNISGVSQNVTFAKKFSVVSRANYLCSPGTFLWCAERASPSSPPTVTETPCLNWECAQCPDGHFTDLPDMEVCQPCLAGTFAIANHSACFPNSPSVCWALRPANPKTHRWCLPL